MHREKLLPIGLIIVGLAILIWLAQFLILPVAVQTFATGDLKQTFTQQSNKLDGGPEYLGIAAGDTSLSCSVDLTDTFYSQLGCNDSKDYTYDAQPPSQSLIAAYPARAAKLQSLLKVNGWRPDHAADPSTLVNINPYSPSNGGQGGSIVYYKNIGKISCNLEIDFNGTAATTENAGVSLGALNVNEFACSQSLSYPSIHFDGLQHHGV